MTSVEFEVIFESGYSHDGRITRKAFETTAYWVEITEAQNPYDLSDYPVGVAIDGPAIPIEDDGEWLAEIDAYALELWPGSTAYR